VSVILSAAKDLLLVGFGFGCPRFRAANLSFEIRSAVWSGCAIHSKRLIWLFGANLGLFLSCR
jgi:hypothetical protein